MSEVGVGIGSTDGIEHLFDGSYLGRYKNVKTQKIIVLSKMILKEVYRFVYKF